MNTNSTKEDILSNVKYIIFYALSLSVALGFNDLVVTIFNSFPHNHIINKTIYVVIMFGITIISAYLFSHKSNS